MFDCGTHSNKPPAAPAVDPEHGSLLRRCESKDSRAGYEGVLRGTRWQLNRKNAPATEDPHAR